MNNYICTHKKNKVTKRYSINMCDGHLVYTTLNIVNKKVTKFI